LLPQEYQSSQQLLGTIHFKRGDYDEAQTSFEEAITTGVQLLASAYTEHGRRFEVQTVSELFAASAFCLLRLKQPGNALLRLEQGKTRLLRHALALADLDLTMLPEGDREAVRASRQAIRELEAEMRLPADTPARRDDRDLADRLRVARAELASLVGTVRSKRPDFMPESLELDEVLDLIPTGGAMIAPFFTAKGSAAFVLPHGTANVSVENVVELSSFTHADLDVLLQGPENVGELGGWLGTYGRRYVGWAAWLAAIENIGKVMWDRLVCAIHGRLHSFGLKPAAPIVLMPQGGLGILPLHAAWRLVNGRKSYFLDDYIVSYSPSAFAFRSSRQRLSRMARSPESSLLAVINPTCDLPFAPAEGDVVLELFAASVRKPLIEQQATLDALMQEATGRNYLHFACHGLYNWREPMQSGVLLAGRKLLTLAEIIGQFDVTAANLVALSACETGITDIFQSPDEYLGLPTGFLQAGAPAVVSTLWAVNDLSTMLLMERFYSNHLHGGLAPAAALREGQLWLRDVTVRELNLADRYENVYQASGRRNKQAYEAARYYRANPDVQPFAHPYYWAAFTFSGAELLNNHHPIGEDNHGNASHRSHARSR
jgi:hypothetical protein